MKIFIKSVAYNVLVQNWDVPPTLLEASAPLDLKKKKKGLTKRQNGWLSAKTWKQISRFENLR